MDLIDLIKQFEGFKPKPYLDSASIPTIGIGTIRYPNGVRVTMRDPEITLAKAEEYLMHDLDAFKKDVSWLTKDVNLNINQYNALVSFAYNVGSDIDIDTTPEGLGDSTLLKKVLINPNDPSIAEEFKKWNKAGGKVVKGLTIRRQKEAELYFTAPQKDQLLYTSIQ